MKKVGGGGVVAVLSTASKTCVKLERIKCEPTSLGESAASGRFRVFREGAIQTDYGLSIMNPSAGRAVIKAFEDRGNDMMIDLRHFSIAKNATREQSEAMGWIPCPGGLEYVDGEGLYAVNVKWVPEVQAGLECTPPKWKYFSPLYDQDSKTKVITALSNVALTNMPATWRLNRLAAERGTTMDNLKLAGECLVLLMALAEGGDEKAIAARDKMVELLGDNAQAALDAATSESGNGGEEVVLTEEEQKAMEALPEDMKATYMAGKKAMTMRTESDEKDKEVAAEFEKDKENMATSISASALMLMAKGAEVSTKGSRERIVAEHAALIPPAMKAIVMDPKQVSDKALAEFITRRKAETKAVTVSAGSRLTLPSKKPESRSPDKVPQTIAAEAERIARVTKTDPKKILAELLDQQKADKAQV